MVEIFCFNGMTGDHSAEKYELRENTCIDMKIFLFLFSFILGKRFKSGFFGRREIFWFGGNSGRRSQLNVTIVWNLQTTVE